MIFFEFSVTDVKLDVTTTAYHEAIKFLSISAICVMTQVYYSSKILLDYINNLPTID